MGLVVHLLNIREKRRRGERRQKRWCLRDRWGMTVSGKGAGGSLGWGRGVPILRVGGKVPLGESVGRRWGGGWLSHIVMQEQADPVRGVVQEQEPLQEAGQEWRRLLHKHGQEHPGGRLEGKTCWGSDERPGLPHQSVPGVPGALPSALLSRVLSPHPLPQCLLLPDPGTPPHLLPGECPPVPAAEPTASLGSPAVRDVVSQVIQLELLEEAVRG